MILVPRPLASYKYNETLSYSKFSLGIHYADSSSMGVVSSPPPAETSADVASPCFDRTGSVQAVLHMQVLWQRQLQKGHSRQQGGTRYGCDIWSGGPIVLQWTVRGDHFQGGTVHGVTAHSLGERIFKWHNIIFIALKVCYVLQLSHAHCYQS